MERSAFVIVVFALRVCFGWWYCGMLVGLVWGCVDCFVGCFCVTFGFCAFWFGLCLISVFGGVLLWAPRFLTCCCRGFGCGLGALLRFVLVCLCVVWVRWLFAICFLPGVCGFPVLLFVLIAVGAFGGGDAGGLGRLVLLSFPLDVGCGIIWFLGAWVRLV